MARVCLVLVAGLDETLLEKAGGAGGTLGEFAHRGAYEAVFPAVTCTAQATLTTGVGPAEHGIICNGLYTRGDAEVQGLLDLTSHAEARRNVSFWEQANGLVKRRRFWEGLGKRVAMLFWQNSIGIGGGAADIVLTPKPTHTAEGKTLSACFSSPGELYGELVRLLGAFPLHNYWSPMAGIGSSQWIVKAAQHVWAKHRPDLQLVYIPHLDFNLLRLGPNAPAVVKDVADVDGLLAPLVEQVRANGGKMVVAGDYGMTEVSTAVTPNVALRQAGLLVTRLDGQGKVVVDYEKSRAFVMVDHQVGYVYGEGATEAAGILRGLAGVGQVAVGEEMKGLGVGTPRAGNAVVLAAANAWLAHDWWLSEEEKPMWQFGVDIHNKPGFDPRELFFDPAKKCIAQNLALPRGSHGLVGQPGRRPVLLSDVALPEKLEATQVAPWLARCLAL